MPVRLNIPPLTRILLVLLLTTSFSAIAYRSENPSGSGIFNHNDVGARFLAIVPDYSVVYPWVIVSATFVELNIISLIITATTIFYGGKYLERAWSSAEFGKFLAVVAIIPNLSIWVVYVLWSIITGDGEIRLEPINGGVALQAGFLVAFKQLVPEHTVALAKGMVKIRVKHFPALFLLGHIVAGIILGTNTAGMLAVFGFLSSWTYLRFYKSSFPDLSTSQPSKLRGDASETFAFAYFFPDPLHGPIASLSGAVYDLLVSLKLCTPFSDADIDAGNSQAAARGEGGLPSLLSRGGGPVTGGARAEAERRRALALKALDQRLHAASSKTQNPAQASTTTGPAMLGETNHNPGINEEESSKEQAAEQPEA